MNILDPDVIVLGGGMSNVERLYQTVPQLIKSFVFGGECETPLRKARHGRFQRCARRGMVMAATR